LISYRFEYIEQFQSRAKSGIQSGQLQQYQQFISQLDVAIEHQKLTVARSGEVLNEKQNHWRDRHSHKRALNKAVNRFRKKENKVKDLDEHNTRKHNEKKLS